ncbi:MAG: mechanosensitive ion channel family protein [Gammaproteobacteria bacterium]|nr:mechanosensitive ion channel family protein [Gammaproteobacteria bacterium]
MIILMVLLGGFCIAYLESLLFQFLTKKLSKNKMFWDDVIVSSLHRPLNILIIISTILIIVNLLAKQFKLAFVLSFFNISLHLVFLLFFTWFVLKIITGTEKKIVKKHKGKDGFDQTSTSAIAQLIRMTVLIIAILIALQLLGIPLSGVLAFGGVSGIAIGFAAKDTLANFLGGLMIYMDRPFSVGDWIRSPEKEIEGTVEKIGWRLTRVRNFDKRPIYIPNALFSTIVLENPSRMSHRRIKAVFNLRYDDVHRIIGVTQDVEKMLSEHEDVDKAQAIGATLSECAPSSLNMTIVCYVLSTALVPFSKVQQDIFLKVLNIIESHKAECAFPTTTVYLESNND